MWTARSWSRRYRHQLLQDAAKALLTYLVLAVLGLITAVPFLWMVVSSLKEPGTLFIYPPQWVPEHPRVANYAELFQRMPFATYFMNSLKISLLATLGELMASSLSAYAFARLHYPGKNLLFGLIMACLMIPYQVTLIPQFIIFFKLGLMDRHLVLWGPAFTGSAFGVFLLRQFFLTLPVELEDAARMDGSSRIGIYWRIFLPLSKPALTTLALFTFMNNWNDLIGPVLYLSTKLKLTLTVGLANLYAVHGATPWHLVMAGAVVSVLPVVLAYLLGQRYFVQGIVMTGLKL